MTKHIFDQAIALEAGSDSPDIWLGKTSPAYWNTVGPCGGISAAILTQAMLLHPDLLGEPVSLKVNYPSGVAPGPYSGDGQPCAHQSVYPALDTLADPAGRRRC